MIFNGFPDSITLQKQSPFYYSITTKNGSQLRFTNKRNRPIFIPHIKSEKKGEGSLLLSSLVGCFPDRIIETDVFDRNKNALRFFRRHGFKKVAKADGIWLLVRECY